MRLALLIVLLLAPTAAKAGDASNCDAIKDPEKKIECIVNAQSDPPLPHPPATAEFPEKKSGVDKNVGKTQWAPTWGQAKPIE
jgi:hypothetical protein